MSEHGHIQDFFLGGRAVVLIQFILFTFQLIFDYF